MGSFKRDTHKTRERYTRRQIVTPDRRELHQAGMNVSMLYLGLMVWVGMFVSIIGHPRPNPQQHVAAPTTPQPGQAWGNPWTKPFGGGGSGEYTRTTPRWWGKK